MTWLSVNSPFNSLLMPNGIIRFMAEKVWNHKTSLSPKAGIIGTDHSKAVILLWILFVIYVSCMSCFIVCLLRPRGHLLGKGWSLDSLLCDIFLCFFHFLFGALGQIYYLIVSIPELFLLTYFYIFSHDSRVWKSCKTSCIHWLVQQLLSHMMSEHLFL